MSPPGAGACDTSEPGDVQHVGATQLGTATATPRLGKLPRVRRSPPPGGAKHQGVVRLDDVSRRSLEYRPASTRLRIGVSPRIIQNSVIYLVSLQKKLN